MTNIFRHKHYDINNWLMWNILCPVSNLFKIKYCERVLFFFLKIMLSVYFGILFVVLTKFPCEITLSILTFNILSVSFQIIMSMISITIYNYLLELLLTKVNVRFISYVLFSICFTSDSCQRGYCIYTNYQKKNNAIKLIQYIISASLLWVTYTLFSIWF